MNYKIHFTGWWIDTGRYYANNTHKSTKDINLVTCKNCIKKHEKDKKVPHTAQIK